jgi:hypothetical protein
MRIKIAFLSLLALANCKATVSDGDIDCAIDDDCQKNAVCILVPGKKGECKSPGSFGGGTATGGGGNSMAGGTPNTGGSTQFGGGSAVGGGIAIGGGTANNVVISEFAITPASLVANATNEATIAVKITDQNGAVVRGAIVSLSSNGAADSFSTAMGLTGIDGIFKSKMTSTKAAVKTVTARCRTKEQTQTVTFVAGPVSAGQSTISFSSSAPVVGDGGTQVIVTVNDAFSNPVVGEIVSLSSASVSDIFDSPMGTSDATGIHLSALTSNEAGPKTITATLDAGTILKSVTFEAGPFNLAKSTFDSNPLNLNADNLESATLTLFAKDEFGNALARRAVVLSVNQPGTTLIAPGILDASGVVSASLKASISGTKVVTAEVDSIAMSVSVNFERAWKLIDAGTLVPSARSHHSMAFDSARGKTVLFGGQSADGGLMNDMWEYDNTGWVKVNQTPVPTPRYGGAMVYDSIGSRLVLFGGLAPMSMGDTWISLDGGWTEVATGFVPKPINRSGHAMAFDSSRNVTVLYGGLFPAATNETWEFGTSWSLRSTSLSGVRIGHTMAFDSIRNLVVLFGGTTSPATNNRLSDTWELSGSMAWLKFMGAPSPSARDFSAMAFVPPLGKMVLFGGVENTSGSGGNGLRVGDMWFFSGTAWTAAPATLNKPSARSGHFMVYDSSRKVIVMFGGITGPTSNGIGTKTNETWEYGP